MERRRTPAAAACLAVLSAFIAVIGVDSAYAATTQQTFLTFYGWWDNTPPGGDIAYPKIHSTAGGTGTFADPITFATSTLEIAAGTKVYVPRVKKYFIMEDSCEECSADWSRQGPNGGPGCATSTCGSAARAATRSTPSTARTADPLQRRLLGVAQPCLGLGGGRLLRHRDRVHRGPLGRPPVCGAVRDGRAVRGQGEPQPGHRHGRR